MKTTRKTMTTKVRNLHQRYATLSERVRRAIESGDVREQTLAIRMFNRTIDAIREIYSKTR